MAKETIDQTDAIAQALARLADIAESGKKVQEAQVKQLAPKSNTIAPKVSVFNPQGEKDYPMPELKCEFYMPWQQKPGMHGCDWEEVELLNLLEPGEFRVELLDGSTAPLTIVGMRNSESGSLERMLFFGVKDQDSGNYGAFYTKERRSVIPPMRSLLRQILGEKADGVMTIKERAKQVREGKLSVSIGA